jgi:putative hemolysin
MSILKLIRMSKALLTPYSAPITSFKRKIPLYIERERFIIKTAENKDDLTEVLKLRYGVFYLELMEKKLLNHIDMDVFDEVCDHLMIIDKRINKCVGTYRLISSIFTDTFYSATEFNIDSILSHDGVKLELGRACVHKDYRTGSTIAMLWRGIAEYVKHIGAKYLFGCSSVMTMDCHEIASLYLLLRKEHLAPADYLVKPKEKYRIWNLENLLVPNKEPAVIPPLIKSYFNMGAMICGEPALDRDFKCVDFLTLFDAEKCNPSTKQKYGL